MNRESIDKVFQKLAIAMFSGGLGPTVYMVKVKNCFINSFWISNQILFRSALRVKTARMSM